jgi:hypothetical protein
MPATSRGKIRQTFQRHADVDPDKIQLAVTDGTAGSRRTKNSNTAGFSMPSV